MKDPLDDLTHKNYPDDDYRNQKCIDLLIELYQRDRINIEEFKPMIKGLL